MTGTKQGSKSGAHTKGPWFRSYKKVSQSAVGGCKQVVSRIYIGNKRLIIPSDCCCGIRARACLQEKRWDMLPPMLARRVVSPRLSWVRLLDHGRAVPHFCRGVAHFEVKADFACMYIYRYIHTHT